jgi:putative DNA primase/helicase
MIDYRSEGLKWFKLFGCAVLATRLIERKGKMSYVPFIEWSMYQSHIMTQAEFEDQPWSKAEGFSLVLGKLSSGKYLTLFDWDNHTKELWKPEDFDDCKSYCEKTPHGFHVLFLSLAPPKEVKDYSELELLCSHHICNMHPETVMKDIPLQEIEDANANFALIADRFQLKPKKGKKTDLNVYGLLSQGVTLGERDNTAIVIASKLRQLNKSKEETLELLLEWNSRLNSPPLDDKTIKEKVESAYKNPVPYFGDTCGKDKQVILRNEVFQNVTRKYRFVSLPNGLVFVYTDGVYVAEGTPEQIVKTECVKVFKEDYQKSDFGEVFDRIKGAFPVPHGFFELTSVDLICVMNGILNIKTRELQEYNPDIAFLNKLPIDFDPRAKCPLIEKTVAEWLESPAHVQAIYEWFGYLLLRQYPIHKALFLIGEGSNGKTTFLNLVTMFIGEENVSHVPFQQLGERFKCVQLFGRLVNLADELSTNALSDSSMFKELTGESPVSGEIKFVQNPIKFKNYAKIVYSCNQLPMSSDMSYAFFRRPSIFRFDNVFSKEHHNIDEHLIEKLTTNSELSGLLNLALQGLQRLLAAGDFSVQTDVFKTQQEWSLDTVADFRTTRLRESLESEVCFTDLYADYVEFCKKKEQKPLAETPFSLRLRKHITYRVCQKQVKGIRRQYYEGIRLATTDSDENITSGEWIQ